jgi:hypothetical protein
MDTTDSLWLIPISIIPGLGMLALSTSARYMTVTLQLREQSKMEAPDLWLSELIYKRACCLQQALLAVYVSITFFVIASLLAAVVNTSENVILLSKWVMFAGGLFAMYSTMHLVYEVYTSRRIIDRDHNNLQKNGE